MISTPPSNILNRMIGMDRFVHLFECCACAQKELNGATFSVPQSGENYGVGIGFLEDMEGALVAALINPAGTAIESSSLMKHVSERYQSVSQDQMISNGGLKMLCERICKFTTNVPCAVCLRACIHVWKHSSG
jgi:hypothetical protein